MKNRYVYETDTEGGSAAARVLRQVGFDKKVLELGTGPGSITRLLKQQNCSVIGVELDAESAELCRQYCTQIIVANLESHDWLSEIDGQRFDVIVAADVLEHLHDPRALLQGLAHRLNDGGYLVISIPNASHLTVLACLLTGRFPYQTTGLLDHSHIRFFGREDVDELLRSSGFLWQRWEAAHLEPSHAELQSYWHRLGEDDRKFLLDRVVDGTVYQHVITAYPTSASGHVSKALADALELRQKFQEERAELNAIVMSLTTANEASTMCIAELERVVEARVGEVQTLQAQSMKLTDDVRRAVDAQLDLSSQHLALQSASAEQADAIHQLRELVEQQQLVLNEQIAENQLLRGERETLFQSHSWRATAPIRSVVRLLRRSGL